MACLIQIRRDTGANWTSTDPVLAIGELGYDQTEVDFKIGDGVTAWSSLPFLINGVAYSDEDAQDAVGTILTDSSTIDFTYNDGTPSITAAVIAGGVDHDSLLNWDADAHVDHSTVTVTGADGLTGGGDLTTSRTITMPAVGTAGTYGSASQTPVLTTDAKGRVTGVVDTDILIDIEDVTDLQVTLDGKHLRHGFEDRTKVDISYNPTTRIVTLTPNDTSYNVWINGVKVTISSVKNTAAHANTSGAYFVTIDGNGDLSISAIVWDLLNLTYTPAVALYYNSTIVEAIVMNELHSADRNVHTHNYLHHVIGTAKKRPTDFAIFGYTLDIGDTSSVTFGLTAGSILDEDIEISISSLSDGGPYTILSRTGVTEWTWIEGESVPYEYGTNIQFNEDSSGFTLTDVANNKFVNYFVVAVTSIDTNNQIVMIPSQLEHDTQSEATEESFEDIDIGDIPIQEIVGLWRLTYKAVPASTAPGYAVLVSVEALSSFGTSSGGIGTGVTVHNALSGRGDLDAHPYTSITEFAEGAQDAVAAMLVDTNTIDFTYTDLTPELKFDVITQMSITSDASGIKLSGDAASPGNDYFYRTNGSGVKGWSQITKSDITDFTESDYVHVTGAESIAGIKTFTDSIEVDTITEDTADAGVTINSTLVVKDDDSLSVAGVTGDYETLVTADDDIPNKKYVDDNHPVWIATIGSYDHPVYTDTTKSSKTLTVATHNFWWSLSSVSEDDWFSIGNAQFATSGHIIPYNATIVGATYHCHETGDGDTMQLNLYVNATQTATLFTTGSTKVEESGTNNTLNINVSAGDKLRIRGGESSESLSATVVTVFVKWRS
jgi:hypothetical protein